VLAADRMRDPQAVARFRREMKAVGKLAHPHLVTATDAGETDGVHFLVMEYVDGEDVGRVLRRCGALIVADACEVARQAALGLQYAHEHGLIHRDVKPSNLMLTRDGEVKVLDLSLALLQGAHVSSEATTSSGWVMGSFDYIAPEQANDSHAVDHRADLYSLGCTLFHMLAGEVPFPPPDYETALQKMRAHAEKAPPPLYEFRSDVPDDLVQIVARLLAKKPADRFGSAAEVAEALAPFAQGADLGRLLGGGQTFRLPAPPPRRRNRRRGPLAAAVLAAGLLAGGLFILRTDNGVLEIQTDDPKVRVVVEQDGNLVQVKDLETGNEIVLKAGKYLVRIDGREDLEMDRDEVTLQRKGKVVATIRRKPDLFAAVPVPPLPDPAALAKQASPLDRLRRDALPAEFRTERVPKELVGVLGGLGPRHSDSVFAVAFSPDGKLLASGSGTWDKDDRPGVIHVRDAATGKRLAVITGHTGMLTGLAFHPDGRRLVSSSLDGTVRVWEARTGRQLSTFRGHTHWVRCVALSPDGKWAASGGGKETDPACEVLVWDFPEGKTVTRLAGHTGPVSQVAFRPDGKRLASTGWDKTLRVWDLGTGREVFKLVRYPHRAQDVSWSPDGGRLAAGCYDRRLRVHDAADGKVLEDKLHPYVVAGVAFSADDKWLASGCWDGGARLWDAKTLEEVTAFQVPKKGGVGVARVAFHPERPLLAAASWGATLKVWDVTTRKEAWPESGHDGEVVSLAMHPAGTLLATGGADGTVRLWDLAGRQEALLASCSDQVHVVTFSRDGKLLASAGWDRRIRVWDVAGRRLLHDLEGAHTEWIEGLAFHPGGKVLASAGWDRVVRL